MTACHWRPQHYWRLTVIQVDVTGTVFLQEIQIVKIRHVFYVSVLPTEVCKIYCAKLEFVKIEMLT